MQTQSWVQSCMSVQKLSKRNTSPKGLLFVCRMSNSDMLVKVVTKC